MIIKDFESIYDIIVKICIERGVEWGGKKVVFFIVIYILFFYSAEEVYIEIEW